MCRVTSAVAGRTSRSTRRGVLPQAAILKPPASPASGKSVGAYSRSSFPFELPNRRQCPPATRHMPPAPILLADPGDFPSRACDAGSSRRRKADPAFGFAGPPDCGRLHVRRLLRAWREPAAAVSSFDLFQISIGPSHPPYGGGRLGRQMKSSFSAPRD